MNVKDFLIDNYIWIIIVILITIITIIGFIADKNKSKKEKAIKVQVTNEENSPIPVNNVGNPNLTNENEQLPNQNNNIHGMNLNNMDTSITPISNANNLNNESSPIENINNAMTTITQEPNTNIQTMTTPMPIENVISQVSSEPIMKQFQGETGISSQQPVTNFDSIMPQQMPLPSSPIENHINSNAINNNQSMMQPNFGINTNPNMNMQQNFGNQMIQQGMNSQQTPMFNPMNNNNNLNRMVQPMANNNINNMTNFNQNNTTIPTPVNSIPTPKPVIPQPIMQNVSNNQSMMQQNFGNQMAQQGMNLQTSQSIQSQPNQNQTTINDAPINFVFGPQDNNSNM